ncbi:uncharacterized protein LOC144448625 [Glandiceps talaboti]
MATASGVKNDVNTVIGLAVTHVIVGLFCVSLEWAIIEYKCYLYTLSVPLWAGTLFMTTGGVGYTLKNNHSSKLVRDFFSLSVLATLTSSVVVAYGVIAAWVDSTTDKDLQVGVDITIATLGTIELCVSITSSIVASRLHRVFKYTPLRTIGEYHTTKNRTILLVPMSADQIPLIYIPDDHKLRDVKVTE